MMLRLLLLLPILVHCGKAGSSQRRLTGSMDTSVINRKPNIVFILTDDQDLLLGSMSAMNKTKYHLGQHGADFVNAFVTSPMCCPSRSSILTGQYVHNHKVYSNVESYCGAPHWRRGPEGRNFGAYMQAASYRTGYFGKYLNNYDGSYIPPGWTEWAGLIGNSKYYKYAINHNGQIVRHGLDYERDYLPDLIANDSITFFKVSKRAFPDRPVGIVLSFPSPHGPEDCAPQYAEGFQNNHLHRTPSWNFSPNNDKHWILQYTQPMTPLQQNFTDMLQRKRLLTLISVDDAVEKLCTELAAMGELDNTYIIYTSDHGYHLGQFGVLKGKSLPYDFDIRVPFYMRGPAIPRGIKVPSIVLNIDIAPTLLDIAGASIPTYMDGVSIMKLFLPRSNYRVHHKSKRWKYKGDEEWRDSFLVERSRSPEDVDRLIQRQQKTGSNRLAELCRGQEFSAPCKAGQEKYCVQDEDGNWMMKKCKMKTYPCVCEEEEEEEDEEEKEEEQQQHERKPTKEQRKKQKRLLRQNVAQGKRGPARVFRSRRSLDVEFDALSGVPMCWVERKVVKCSKEVLLEDSVIEAQEKLVKAHLKLYRRHITDLKHIHRYLKKAKDAKFIPYPSPTHQPTSQQKSKDDNKLCICEDFTEDDPSSNSSLSLRPFGRDRRSASRKRANGRKPKKKGEILRQSGCKAQGMSCFYHDSTHWKTPPLWTADPVCACTNNQNNSYWCIRTLNGTHNLLYCEYVTGFVEFFDMRPSRDPYQLTNAVKHLKGNKQDVLSKEVRWMKVCYGASQCTMNSTGKATIQSQQVIEPQTIENFVEEEENPSSGTGIWKGWEG